MKFCGILTPFLLLLGATSLHAQTETLKLLGDFEDGWGKKWMERRLGRVPTLYQVFTEEDSNRVLMAVSERSASGLWHMLEVQPGNESKISWRWKIDNTLSKDNPERTKKNDDYAARIFVVFDPHFVSWRTRAICYVWAANEPVGASYLNPYSSTVHTIVLQSGSENQDKWVREEREFVRDYIEAFGKPPEMVTAVAIMVDTDNTGQNATTWFDDLVLDISPKAPPPKEAPEIEAGVKQ